MIKPLAAICVGHSRLVAGSPDGGAESIDHVSEWKFYHAGLAGMIQEFLAEQRIQAVVMDRYIGTGYSAAQRWLAAQLDALEVRAAVELHFNASDDSRSNGHEWLHWIGSTRSKSLATHLSDEYSLGMPGIRARGVKALTAGDNGYQFCHGPRCPAVIAEIGFATNPGDWAQMSEKPAKIARAIAEGIAEFLD